MWFVDRFGDSVVATDLVDGPSDQVGEVEWAGVDEQLLAIDATPLHPQDRQHVTPLTL